MGMQEQLQDTEQARQALIYMPLHYTHIWSYAHALYPYMVIIILCPCIIPIYGHMPPSLQALIDKVTKLTKQLMDVNSMMAAAQGREMELGSQLHDAQTTNDELTSQLEKTVTEKGAEIEKLTAQLMEVNKTLRSKILLNKALRNKANIQRQLQGSEQTSTQAALDEQLEADVDGS